MGSAIGTETNLRMSQATSLMGPVPSFYLVC